MSWQGNDAILTLGGEDIGFVKSISISKEGMGINELEFNPFQVKTKTITFTGWIVRPKIMKSKSKQARAVRVVNKNPALGGA